MSKQVVSIDFDGKEYSIETGKFAKFASSVMVRCADSMVLVTAVADTREDLEKDFLPLQVEYREKTASGGKIPGGFLKREGRPSDHEVLCSRLIDRATRPLITKSWRFETQVIATVFSFDPAVSPDTLGAVGASAALLISDVPFNGPFSEVRVGRIDGKLVVNPSFDDLKQSDIDMTIAGTDAAILMVEGESQEISEDEFLEVLTFAHEKIKVLNKLQKDLAALLNIEKRSFTQDEPSDEFKSFVKDSIIDELRSFVHTKTSKQERQDKRSELHNKALELVQEKFGEDEAYEGKIEKYLIETLEKLEKNEMREMILSSQIRLDGRGLTDIRNISCEAGVLPRVHGSALFTRGETQALATATLGTKHDEQMVDGLQPAYTNNFYLHYNFPPFSTGEVKRLGTGRREIGHGNLAERALKKMMPESSEFPYVVRVVSDVLESNGSSSMATVCSGALALYDAGVPLKKTVAGIAMGLIKEDDRVAVLSDILGDEDHLGDMDFKVTGTVDGITACQMDIKIEGLSLEIMRQALEQAKQGRLHIIDIMDQTLDAPRTNISKYAPTFTKIRVPIDMIGTVIGPGGETIRGIVKETGAEINIDDEGVVTIAAVSKDAADEAEFIIQGLVEKPREGEIYTNVPVKEIREGLGAFIEFLPRKQGLLHISQVAHERTENVGDILKVGDKIDVKLLEVTRDGKFRLSRKALMPRPEGMPETEDRPERPHRSSSQRDGNRRGPSRGGNSGRDNRR